ncbi:MAG: DUF2029 domain-containing protein [Chloroflexi bacterium]|nr:DUF2029 domain-containing protein [Chloroflexota bacterium]
MTRTLLTPTRIAPLLVLLLVLLLVAAAFITFFERLPVEGTTFLIDWGVFWKSIQDGNVVYYSAFGLRIPPWSVLFILPLGFVSLRTAWALLALATILILIISVPRRTARWRHRAGMLLLGASFLTLRVIVDGNFEGLIVGGVLLMLWGYDRRQALPLGVGILLATIKPQTVFLLIAVIGLYLLEGRQWRLIGRTAAITLAIVIPTLLWRGSDWLVALGGENNAVFTGNLLDITLGASLRRAGDFSPVIILMARLAVIAATLVIAWRARARLTRESAGLLIAASILCAPYAAGNSVLTYVAIGVIPFFQKRPLPGLLLIGLMNAALLLNQAAFVGVASYYWTLYTLLTWSVLAWHVWTQSPAAAQVHDAITSVART